MERIKIIVQQRTERRWNNAWTSHVRTSEVHISKSRLCGLMMDCERWLLVGFSGVEEEEERKDTRIAPPN